MKNDWLERKAKKTINRDTLDKIDVVVKRWQDTGKGTDRVFVILYALSHQVMMNYVSHDLSEADAEEVREEMVEGCLFRLRRLDTEKGRVFNYFTTIMLAILRQHTVKPKDLKKLKEEYREYLASRNSRNRDRRKA